MSFKDSYHLTTKKLMEFKEKILPDGLLTKRAAVLTVATLLTVSAYALSDQIPHLDSRNPAHIFSLAPNDLEKTIGASLGITNQSELSSKGYFSLSGPLASGLYDSFLEITGLEFELPALRNLTIILGGEFKYQEPTQTLDLTLGVGDTFANNTTAFGMYAFVTTDLHETTISAKLGAEKDINHFSPFGSLTVNATSAEEKWNSELEAGIKYHFNNGSQITTSGALKFDEKGIAPKDANLSYSNNNITGTISYLPEESTFLPKEIMFSIEADF